MLKPAFARLLSALFLLGVCLGFVESKVHGEIVLVGGFFSGQVDRVNVATGALSNFSTVATGDDPFPGISGLAYNPISNVVYATARVSSRIYFLNPDSGAVTGFHQLSSTFAPAGIAVDRDGFVYVANNAGNSITKFNSGFNKISDIELPNFGIANNQPNAMAFDNQGKMIISTFGGAGLMQYDPGTGNVTSFNSANPVANGQVAINGAGDVYVGGAAFSSDVTKLDSSGTITGGIAITESLLPKPPLGFTSPDFTSPAGVTIDASGNVIVAALGRTNPTSPSDNFQNNGGVFIFSSTGSLLASNTQTTPYSSALSFTAVPEPTSMLAATVGIATLGWLRRRRGIAKR